MPRVRSDSCVFFSFVKYYINPLAARWLESSRHFKSQRATSHTFSLPFIEFIVKHNFFSHLATKTINSQNICIYFGGEYPIHVQCDQLLTIQRCRAMDPRCFVLNESYFRKSSSAGSKCGKVNAFKFGKTFNSEKLYAKKYRQHSRNF